MQILQFCSAQKNEWLEGFLSPPVAEAIIIFTGRAVLESSGVLTYLSTIHMYHSYNNTTNQP